MEPNPEYCIEYNVDDIFKPMLYEDVVKIQQDNSIPISCAAVNISGSLNIGMMIRTAVIFGCRDFYIIGKRKYDKRSTVGADKYINIRWIDCDPFEFPQLVLPEIESDGYQPVCVEQGGTDINAWYTAPHSAQCFIMGSESEGLPKYFTDSCPIISIDQRGVLRSLNVSAACAIVLHKVATDLKGYQFDYETKRPTYQVAKAERPFSRAT